MNSRILVYSPEAELRDAISTWGQQEDSFTIQIVDQPEAIPEAITCGDYAAVILDDSDGALPLTALTHDLATQLPQSRILVFPPSAATDTSEIKDAILHGYLSKPFSCGELQTALRGVHFPVENEYAAPVETIRETTAAPLLKQTESQLRGENPSPVDGEPGFEDLGFLKGWLYEENEAENVTPLPEIELRAEPVDPQEFTATAAATTGSEITADEASIIPADLVTVISTLQHAPESEIPTETGIPQLNLHSLRLPYSCVLIPRDPQRYLVGELPERLGLMLPRVHLNRGWRVTGMSIRPLYMQWFAALPLDINPVQAVSEIRQFTSASILNDLPELKTSADDEGFWAPGYLVLSGNLAPPSSIIREFIQRTRRSRDLES